MNTRHNKLMNLKEDDDDNEHLYTYSNKRRKHKDSDDEYNINDNEDDSYSNVDEEEEEDASYMIKNELKEDFKKKPSKKTKTNTNKNTKKNILRKSFKNSLGRQKINKNTDDNKENINNNIRIFSKDNKNKKQKMMSCTKSKKDEISKIIKEKQLIDINLDKSYFYQNLTQTQWNDISNYISSSLFNKKLKEEDIESFFSQYPNLSKGENNIKKLRQILENSTKNNNGFLNFHLNNFEFESYKKLNEFILNKYYMIKPTIFEVHFFPNPSEEIHLINLISKTRTSLDIAMFTINNTRIAEEIKNIFNKGINLRILSDGECIKMPSSNIYSLAALGINIKIDDSVRYHMHHKFCVIDNSVVVTGSFNWTDQAVKHNQENLLFLENRNLAKQYSKEFQKLWDDFEIVITKEKAIMKINEAEEKKRAAESRKKKEKEKKLIEKENNKKKEFDLTENKDCKNNFSKKKRNRNENNENIVNENYNNQDNYYDYENNKNYGNYNEYERRNYNSINNINKGSKCFIF